MNKQWNKDGLTRKKLENDFSFMSYAPIIFISAKTGQRLNNHPFYIITNP